MSIKWGVVGPGRIARTFATAMQDSQVGEIIAVASSSSERARLFAKEFQVESQFTDYDELFQCKSIDAVYIATTHNFHFELALKAIEQGKHLLIEKPIAINQQQAQEIFSAAKAKKVFVMEAVWSLFLPIYRQIDDWIAEGLIGEINHLTSSFGFLIPRDTADRLLNPDLAGGALLDMGIYNVATSLWFMKQYPEKIVSECFIGPTGVDETTSLQLTYGNGAVSQTVCSFRSQMVNDLFIYGDKGHIRIHPDFWGSETATLVTQEKTIKHECPFDINGFEYQIRHAEQCIKMGKVESEIMSHNRTLNALKLMDTVKSQH